MSGLNKYTLLNSTQAGSFTNQNKHIDIVIDESYGVIDMSQCFIQLVTRCITNTSQVHNMCLRNTTTTLTPKNVDLIRNCWLSGAKVGRLEDIARVNVLQSNLLEMTKSTSEKFSLVDTIYQVRDFQEGMLLSPWVEMHKEGIVPSTYRDSYLRIPLNQLFSLGNSIVDLGKTGSITVHVELEDLSYLVFEEVKMFHSPALLNEGSFANVESAGSVITTSINYDSVEGSPYFVGQRLNISWIREPTPERTTPVAVTVEAITYNIVTKKITLQISYAFDFTTTPAYTSILVTEVSAGAGFATLSVANANLGVAQVAGGKMEGDVLEYTTYSVEQYSNNANTLEKIFEVEGNAVNAFLMFNNNTSNLISTNPKVKDYRMRIDNSDVYDRNINVNYNAAVGSNVLCHDPLHYDSINRTFLNAALSLKSLLGVSMLRNNADNSVTLADRFKGGADGDKELSQLILCTPLPLTAGMKKLQFSVATKGTNDTIQNVILFKQIIRSVRLA
jgi:hypothetical protein